MKKLLHLARADVNAAMGTVARRPSKPNPHHGRHRGSGARGAPRPRASSVGWVS